MGGINHQPCGKKGTSYLQFSTQMSRALSAGRANLELANVELENILLNEMEWQHPPPASLMTMESLLGQSAAQLRQLIQKAEALGQNMKENNYQDLSVELNITPATIARELARTKIASPDRLHEVAGVMSAGTFYAVLESFKVQADTLHDLTVKLMKKTHALKSHTGSVKDIMEQNQALNMKVEFAELYSGWNNFQEYFLASSMISTELWYRYQGVGTLLPTGAQRTTTGVA